MDQFVQFLIAATGAGSIYFLSDRDWKVRRWGYVVGLAGEPAWIYAGMTAEPLQWGVVFLAMWWSVFFVRGIFNNWEV